jgi:hypothetical protein
MTQYMILIFGDEQRWAAMSPDEWAKIDAGHQAFRDTARTAVLAAGQLEASTTATTLRAGSATAPSITDGPFLETKEGIGGFYVVEAADLDTVIKYASVLHEVRADHSGVEIRPLVDHG